MGIKLGDISPFAGAMTGKGIFGKGLAKLADSGAGFLIPASYMAQSQRNKNDRRTAATAAEAAAIKKAEFDAKRRGAAAGMGGRGAPIMAGDVDAMMGRSAQSDVSGMKKGGKLPDLTGDGKVTRADVLKGRGVPGFKKGSKVSAAQAVHKHERAKHKGQPLTKMAKGGSTASKRGDGCCSKGKTKGRFV